jgi:hypothetical protein
MNDQILQEMAVALESEWQLQAPQLLNEEAIVALLTEKILGIIQQGPDAFYRLMYRIDIPEKRLAKVLGKEDTAQQIAHLVYNRQLEKITSRHLHRQQPGDIDPDMKW